MFQSSLRISWSFGPAFGHYMVGVAGDPQLHEGANFLFL